ncbi:S1 family peptidase [Isoptericola sp. NPDC057191]|uniref:S1 family peptidase n=1 Tax=Isoptericola sp. NPDC057191 TaxID=3346041 RepID=UPI0036331B62
MADQEAVTAALADLGVSLGADADVWIEQIGDAQEVNVRTQDLSIANALSSLDLSASTEVTTIDEPPIAVQVPALDATLEESVREFAPDVQGVYVRTEDGALVVETEGESADVDLDAMAESTGFPQVVTEQVGTMRDDAITARGGVGMATCTAGFPATYQGTKGVVSAAHCGTSQNLYTNTAGTGAYVSTVRATQRHGATADIGYYRMPTGNYLSSSFFGSSASSATTLGGAVDVPKGATVCHRGKTTGWSCGKITSLSYKPTYDNACNGSPCEAVFVQVADAETKGGDSGGPWVSGRSPVGIHKGSGGGLAIYSKISRLPSGVALYY